jgi:hypothetical protein
MLRQESYSSLIASVGLSRRGLNTKNPKNWVTYMKESKPAAATLSQLLQRTKELGVDFLDHENVLWMFCPEGKVFDFGDAGHHYLFHEYGKNRSKFMWNALENMHPQFELQFVPSLKTEGCAELLEMLKFHPLIDCTEAECERCRFRRQLPPTAESLLKLVQFCLQYDFSY